jgi:hypothetical protein
MTADITQHPACRPVPAVQCVDCLDQAVETIRAGASMLYALAKHTRQPIKAAWLDIVARVTETLIDDADHTADLWRHLPADPLPAADHATIGAHLAELRQHADRLDGWSIMADECPPSRAAVADLTARLLAAAEALGEAVEAAWSASPTQPAPAA